MSMAMSDGEQTPYIMRTEDAATISGKFTEIHTYNHVDCPPCIAARSRKMRTLDPDLPANEALTLWLEMMVREPARVRVGGVDRPGARHRRETTLKSYAQYADSLELFFGTMQLSDIRMEHLEEYQRLRILGEQMFVRRRRPHEEPGVCPASPKKTNQELAMLRRIMQRAGAWTAEMAAEYVPLEEGDPETDATQRALTREEQDLWLYTAAQKPEWNLVLWYSHVAIGQTHSTNEMRFMRLADINLFQQWTGVGREGAKAKTRERTNAILTGDVLWACQKLLERAKECGSTDPFHYVMPFRERGKRNGGYDPTRPMSTSGIKREWQEVREATGLLWFRQYDCRHTGSTRNAEKGMPEAMRDKRMGHTPGSKMKEHYTHIQAAAEREWYEEYQRREQWKTMPQGRAREALLAARQPRTSGFATMPVLPERYA